MVQYFKSADLENLKIDHFIFHIIVKEEDQPRFLDSVPLTEGQTAFFKEQFKLATRRSHEYQFTDQERSEAYRDIHLMVSEPAQHFVEASKRLASRFHGLHSGNAKDGIFIVAQVSLTDGARLFFLIKMDHKDVLNYSLKNADHSTQAILRMVANPIVQSTEAIQKVAIIDISGSHEWDVLASDRGTGSKPTITGYFSNFLQIQEMPTAVKWMNKAVDTVQEWALVHIGELDQLPGIIKEKAIAYMENNPEYEAADFVNTLLSTEAEENVERLRGSLMQYLDEEGLSNITFAPQPSQIKDKKNKLITREGVTITWRGSLKGNFIEVRKPEETGDGLYHILIRTETIQ